MWAWLVVILAGQHWKTKLSSISQIHTEDQGYREESFPFNSDSITKAPLLPRAYKN